LTDRLYEMDDEELGQLVRRTATFRAAAACAQFAEGVDELRENDSLAFGRLVDETHAEQSSSVQSKSTTREIVDTFLDVVQEHAQVADEPADATERAAEEVVDP
jgi:hypothetical protein